MGVGEGRCEVGMGRGGMGIVWWLEWWVVGGWRGGGGGGDLSGLGRLG